MSAKSILIVDDEPLNVVLLNEILEDEGYNVISAYDGEAAISQFHEYKPDLVLLDVMMPGIDGYETCRRLRADADNDIPISFLSAKAYLDDKLKGYEAGGDEYITKPFKNEELLAKVSIMLTKKEQLEQSKTATKEAASLATILMTESAKVGASSRFLSESVNCTDETTLCDKFFHVSRDGLGARSTLRFHNGDRFVIFNDDNVDRPLETDILESCHPSERIFHFGNNRVLFSWDDNVSLLVTNLGDNADPMAILLDAFCASLRALTARRILTRVLEDFQENNQALKMRAFETVSAVQSEFESLINSTGVASNLTIEEETCLLGVVDKTKIVFEELVREGAKMEKRLTETLNTIQR